MSVQVLLSQLAARELLDVRPEELPAVQRVFERLGDHPLLYQSAEIRGKPDVRRAVAGNYLVYYQYYSD